MSSLAGGSTGPMASFPHWLQFQHLALRTALELRTYDAVPPHQHAGDEHDRRHQPEDGPYGFQPRNSPAAEVQARHPHQNRVANVFTTISRPAGLQEPRERIRNAEIDSRHAPYQEEPEQPEAHRAVEVPREAAPSPKHLDGETPSPAAD